MARTRGKAPTSRPARPARPSRAAPWKRYASGTEVTHFVNFCRDHLVLSNDRWAGQPLLLDPFQRRMMGEAMAYDELGLAVWRSIVIIIPRKNGKTQLLAAYAVYRLVTSDDQPEILLSAASDRNAGRLFNAAASFIRRSPELSELLRVRDYIGEIVREDGGGTLYRVASDPNRLHGYDPSLVIADELGQWTKPSLEQAYGALTSGGGARGAPQTFTITTAGEASTRHSSILGRLLDAADEASDTEQHGALRIARLHEAQMLVYEYSAPTTDPYDAKAMKLANPAPWITTEYLLKQAANPELTSAQVLQLHGCVWAATDTTFIGPEFVQASLKRGRDRELVEGERIVVAFDGSETRDETWLVGCTLDGFVQPLFRWARPKEAGEHWRIPRGEIDDALEVIFQRYDVVELACDPPGWYKELDEWTERYGGEEEDGPVLAFETRQPSRMAPACERTKAALHGGELDIGGPLAGELAKHLGQCVAKPTPYGIVVTKDHPDSPRKIDGAVATCIAVDRASWHAQNAEEEEFAFVFDPSSVKPEGT